MLEKPDWFNGLKEFNIFAKSFILDVWLGSEYASTVSFQ